MRIGFDAKRAFFNYSGLGNYSRNMIQYLQGQYPENDYYLYIPGKKERFPKETNPRLHYRFPERYPDRKLPSFWRTFWLKKQLQDDRLDIYHGLSNELPAGIATSGIHSVVTIHDLIFIRFPDWYPPIDRWIYRKKSKYAAKVADLIIAISTQTKNDLIGYYGIDPAKIRVIYQGCDPVFYDNVPEKYEGIRKKYNLPREYLLNVGTIEKRKNLLSLLEAIQIEKIDVPLVVVGRQTSYMKAVRDYLERNRDIRVLFLHDVPTEDLPPIYQMAECFIYPSVFEGFGIPILEALNSGTAVITSSGGCFPEAGGPASKYVDPGNTPALGEAIREVLEDSSLKEKMVRHGLEHALKFREDRIAGELMQAYQSVIS